MNTEDTRVQFYHQQFTRGGYTVAYQVTEFTSKPVVEYAVAFCSPLDNFSKRDGRVKSAGRLKSDNSVMLVMSRDVGPAGTKEWWGSIRESIDEDVYEDWCDIQARHDRDNSGVAI